MVSPFIKSITFFPSFIADKEFQVIRRKKNFSYICKYYKNIFSLRNLIIALKVNRMFVTAKHHNNSDSSDDEDDIPQGDLLQV